MAMSDECFKVCQVTIAKPNLDFTTSAIGAHFVCAHGWLFAGVNVPALWDIFRKQKYW
jgi:hypothetical protein